MYIWEYERRGGRGGAGQTGGVGARPGIPWNPDERERLASKGNAVIGWKAGRR